MFIEKLNGDHGRTRSCLADCTPLGETFT